MNEKKLWMDRFAGLVLLIGTLAAGACDAPAAALSGRDFEVRSEPATGLLARIDYVDGSHVEFTRPDDGGVFTSAVFNTAGGDPLEGFELGKLLPSEIFTYLTRDAAPAELRTAEQEAGLVSDPEASAMLAHGQPDGSVASVSHALSWAEFFDQFCLYENPDFCAPYLSGGRKVKSGSKVEVTEGYANVLTGAVRFKVYKKRLVGSDDLLGTTTAVAQPDFKSIAHFINNVSGIDREMYVVVEDIKPSGTLGIYHLSVDFRD